MGLLPATRRWTPLILKSWSQGQFVKNLQPLTAKEGGGYVVDQISEVAAKLILVEVWQLGLV